MICKNCGGEIDDNILLCPYCQSENEKIAIKEQDQYIESYKAKTKELKNVPDRLVKKSSKVIVLTAVAVLAIFLVCIITGYGISKCVGDNSLDERNKHLKKLEEYYNNGEYDKIGKYLDSKDLYGASYEKYRRAYYLYDGMEWKIESIENEVELIKEIDVKVENVASSLSYIMDELVEIRQMEAEDFIYDEEKAAKEIKDKYVEVLTKKMLLTEEEIEEAVDEYIERDSCVDIAELAIERIKDSVQ